MLPSTRTLGLICAAAFAVLIVAAVVLPAGIGGDPTSPAARAAIGALLLCAVVFLFSLVAVGVRVVFHAMAALVALHSPGAHGWARLRSASDIVIVCLWAIWIVGLIVAANSPWAAMLLGW